MQIRYWSSSQDKRQALKTLEYTKIQKRKGTKDKDFKLDKEEE